MSCLNLFKATHISLFVEQHSSVCIVFLFKIQKLTKFIVWLQCAKLAVVAREVRDLHIEVSTPALALLGIVSYGLFSPNS